MASDNPLPGLPLETVNGPLNLQALVFGGASFSYFYNTEEHNTGTTPVDTVRLALRYGIQAFDTSVYYGNSEVILGNALDKLKDEFPRSSYKILTKCGRFGANSFDYSPSAVRQSVKRSLERFHTDYLDVVYLHDTEFVATARSARQIGDHSKALTEEQDDYGLIEGQEGQILGEGDQKVLDAFAELRKMQDEGLIKQVGITGYPLPTVLRLALLILHTPPFKPVDIIMSYSHLNLQNSSILDFVPAFRERAKVPQLLSASPINMGLLTPAPPKWHPAPPGLLDAVKEIQKQWTGSLPELALEYAMREGADMPLVVGLSNEKEVHEVIRVWRKVKSGEGQEESKRAADIARNVFKKAGFLNWSWASP